jgi:hypothetical protein
MASIVLSGVVEIPSSIKVIQLFSTIFSILCGNQENDFNVNSKELINFEKIQADQ